MGGPFLRLPLFEGPLDLLLHLAQREAVPLSELPLAQVTAQFLAYIDVMDALEIEICGEFVEIAALLCLLKSRELLPGRPEEEEDAEIEDPREELIARLVEYASFRDAARLLGERPRLGRDFFVRSMERSELEEFAPDVSDRIAVDVLDLLSALRDLLERRRAAPPLHAVPSSQEPIEARMRTLLNLFAEREQVSLAALVDEAGRPTVITVFLALLELVRRGWVGLQRTADEVVLFRRFVGSAPAVGSAS